MGSAKNTLDRSDISTYPIKVKYSGTYLSSSGYSQGITLNRGTNTSYNSSSIDFLNYALVRQLYYQEYITGSLIGSASYWNSDLQSTAAEGTFDNDYRYFPTESAAQITVMAIPRTVFGENIGRKSLVISGSTYRLIDDGNGNIIDTFTTGSQPSTNDAYASDGVRLYSPGYNIDGTGTATEWKTANAGGTYAGTFWTNPVTANKTGRLNYTGLWSAKSLTYFGDFNITFNITAASDTTYYFGIGCDNYGSLYLDGDLILSQIIPDATGFGGNYKYWHIYPVDITAGTHVVKFVGTNAGIPDPTNPGSMGIEVYNNTAAEITSIITAAPMGSSVPGGLNLIYSSKDYLTNTTYSEYTHVGNVLYSQGIVIITNLDYKYALIDAPSTTTSTTTTTTTAPTTTTTSTTTTTTTAEPTTTTSTTTTTTTSPYTPILLGYDPSLGSGACSQYTTDPGTYYIAVGEVIGNGKTIYSSTSPLTVAPNGFLSDGTNYWTVTSGVLSGETACGTTTTTTSTTTTTTTEEPTTTTTTTSTTSTTSTTTTSTTTTTTTTTVYAYDVATVSDADPGQACLSSYAQVLYAAESTSAAVTIFYTTPPLIPGNKFAGTGNYYRFTKQGASDNVRAQINFNGTVNNIGNC